MAVSFTEFLEEIKTKHRKTYRRRGAPRKYGRHGLSVPLVGSGYYRVCGPRYMGELIQRLADDHNMSRSGFVIWLVNEYADRLQRAAND